MSEEFDILGKLAEYRRPSTPSSDVGEVRSVTVDPAGRKLRPSERLLASIENDGFDMTELGPVLKTGGSQVIVSCAGSGKTTALNFKILYDSVTGEMSTAFEHNGRQMRAPDPVWVCTFLKTGAEEIKSTVRKYQRRYGVVDQTSSIKFSTIHAEFRSVLVALGIDVKFIDETGPKENKKLLKEALKVFGFSFRAEEMNELMGCLTYTRNRLDEARYDMPFYKEKNMSPTVLDAVLSTWQGYRLALGYLDFEDMQDLLYKFLAVDKNEVAIKLVENRYKFIFMDEFQDTSQVQYEIIKVYARKAKKLVVIGDDDQTIYTWRGSDNDIITKRVVADFNPTISKLTKNYRCPSNILDPVIPSISRNENRYPKDIKSAIEGGVLRIGWCGDYANMTRVLVEGIQEDMREGNTVAVLCRTNIDGLVPALLLDKGNTNIRYSVSGSDMTLDSGIGKNSRSIMSLVKGRGGSEFEKALAQLTYGNDEARMLSQACRTQGKTLWQLDPEEIAYSTPKSFIHISEWMGYIASNDPSEVNMLKYLFEYFKAYVYTSDSQYSQTSRSVLEALSVLLSAGEYSSVQDFMFEVDEINERLLARKKTSNVEVKIATVHEFKGKEADSVYVWNDSEGVFPHIKSDDVEEERRLHYIACTRAKKKSTILSNTKFPSPFLKEMNLSGAELLRVSAKRTF